MSVIEQVREYLVENFLALRPGSELNDNDSLLDTGIIDSTGVLELVAYVEGEFGIRVEDTEIVPANFDSISRIAAYARRKLDNGRAT